MKRKTTHYSIITASILISIILSISVDLSKLELGALANVFFPPIIGIVTVCIYTLTFSIIKRTSIILTAILCLINILTGIIFHFIDF